MLLTRSRGIRNNNPGNIRSDESNEWVGQIGVDGSKFVVFDTPENGIRAMVKILRSYSARGVNTLGGIVATWAPAIENNVDAYVAGVKARSGLISAQVIDEAMYLRLIDAMIYHENGEQPYSMATIRRGVALA